MRKVDQSEKCIIVLHTLSYWNSYKSFARKASINYVHIVISGLSGKGMTMVISELGTSVLALNICYILLAF